MRNPRKPTFQNYRIIGPLLSMEDDDFPSYIVAGDEIWVSYVILETKNSRWRLNHNLRIHTIHLFLEEIVIYWLQTNRNFCLYNVIFVNLMYFIIWNKFYN